MSSRAGKVAAAATAAAGMVTASSFGAPVQITSHVSDFEASYQQNGTADDTYAARAGGTGGDELRVGYGSSSGGIKFNAVYYFQLPNVAPGSITSASFSTSSLPDDSTGVAPAHDADLWALGFDNNVPPITAGDANGDAAAADYYYDQDGPDTGAGAEAGVFRNNQKIMDSFLTPGDFVANGGSAITKTTSAGADATLLAYIQGLYSDPNFIPGQSSLIVRVNPDPNNFDTTTSGTRRYNISSSGLPDNTAATSDPGAILPTLTLDVVPEPASAALAGLAGAMLLLKRRR